VHPIVMAIPVVLYFAGLVVLAAYALHRLVLLRLDRRLPALPAATLAPAFTPHVTVQLPLYNERYVVERLLNAVGALDYPRDRLEVQVLDDSSDDTTARVAAGVARLRAAGIDAVHVRRSDRTGYKAGALAAGTTAARGEFLLLLDADFLPPPDLIRRLLPPLQDPAVAMTQARWGHTNAHLGRFTRVQARVLDAHFLLETAVRARAGVFFNFHGTAGMWRRAAVEDAGGWRADTLTEDLDLSYRAQMRGWRFAYLPDVVVPAELPETLGAFRAQQARWAQGTIAVARRVLPGLLRGRWPWRLKAEALVHLTTHIVYPATLLVAVTAVPAMVVRRSWDAPWLALLDVAFAAAIILPVRHFFRVAAQRAGQPPPALREIPYLLLTGVALSVSNSRAVWRGLRGASTPFVRTPKSVVSAGRRLAPIGYGSQVGGGLRAFEGGLAVYLACGIGVAATHGAIGATPFLAALALAFGTAAVRS
jgi:cellulose synthase/poly-beta-1,6-N-acetylglucosamine synthase-like glycosyltransferase